MTSTTTSKGAMRLIMNTVAASLIAAGSLAGVAQAADSATDSTQHGGGHHGMQHGGGHHGMRDHGGQRGEMDPARAEKRMEHMIEHRVPDATAEQKLRLKAIAAAARKDMEPLKKQQHAARAESMKLLAQPNIDRAALEKVRASQMAVQQSISQRRLQAMADAAEVLTPAQRAKIAERMAKRMQKHHS